MISARGMADNSSPPPMAESGSEVAAELLAAGFCQLMA